MDEIQAYREAVEGKQPDIPEDSPRSWIQNIGRIFKNRALRIVALSLAVHGGVAASGILTKDETPIIKLRAGLPKGIQQAAKEYLIELADNDEKLIEEINKEDIKKVETKKAEREKRIDPAKIEAHKREIREQLLQGKKIRFLDFFEKYEELVMGIDPDIIQRGKAFLEKQIAELKKEKGKITDKELLQKIANLIDDKKEDYTAIDDTDTSLFEYLNSQADAAEKDSATLLAACNPREKKAIVTKDELPPGQQDKIFYQIKDKHIRAGFRLNEKEHYVFEPGKLILLTPENTAGTIINDAQRILRRYAGLEVAPLKLEPGTFTPGKPMPIKEYPDGLGEPLPEGIQLASDSESPGQLYANWGKNIDEIEDKIEEIEKIESAGRAKKGITDVTEIVEELNDPHIMTELLEEREKYNLERGRAKNIVSVIHPISVEEVMALNKWQGKLPLVVEYDSETLFFYSPEALKEVSKTKAASLFISLTSIGLPEPFMDALDPCELKIERLEILTKKMGRLPPDQLKKIMSCNTKVTFKSENKDKERAVWLHDYNLSEEEAEIIASVNKGGIWLTTNKIIYSDNILRILASRESVIMISVETENQLNKYKRQSPWLFEDRYYLIIYSQEEMFGNK